MTNGQRFCPLCDRTFTPGEAVLRCTGCEVLHHPSCWVTNGGCATTWAHESAPIAQAYGAETGAGDEARTSAREPAPHEREAPLQFTPRARPQAVSESSAARRAEAPPIQRAAPPPPLAPLPDDTGYTSEEDTESDEHVIGADDIPPMPGVLGAGRHPSTTIRTKQPIPYSANEPRQRRGRDGRSGMPSMYRRHRVLAYWYIPVAILLSIGVAWGVVLAGDQFFGGDDDPAASAEPTATPEATQSAGGAEPTGTAQAGAEGTTSPAGTTTPSAVAGGVPVIGDSAIVVTGGDCLNIREAPGSGSAAVDCLAEGLGVTVTEGPEAAGGLEWVRVTSEAGHDGWVALEYLQKQ